MALIIEDGSIVAGANSFVTVQEVRDYCSARGLELLVDGNPATDAQIEILIIKATDYLGYLEPRFQGHRYDPENQELPFPRSCILFHGADIGGLIPKVLKDALARLAFDSSGQDLLTTVSASSSGEIVKEKVGPLEVQYDPNSNNQNQPEFTSAMALLEPLFGSGSGSSGHGININCSR